MADFDQLKKDQDAARGETVKKSDALFIARERLGRANAAEKPDAADIQKALDGVQTATDQYKLALKNELDFVPQLQLLTDPRKAMGLLDGSVPVLMFPVRIETRFRMQLNPPELWVRVYPDDCSTDTFEPTISENELQNVRAYWAGIFQAGRVPDQERGAWRALAASHGPGRAEWLIGQHAPANLATRESKTNPEDVILTIVTDEPPPGDAGAIILYWMSIWLADGDKVKEDAASAAFSAARLAEIRSKYVPTNIDENPEPPLRRNEVGLSAQWVEMPNVNVDDLRRRTWARAAKVDTLPDRFLFIGYRFGQAQPYEQLGNPIPSSLHVGPDPAAPQDEQLRQVPQDQPDAGELIFPEEMQWMVDFDRAVEVGMGFRINLAQANALNGFTRVLVAGVRVTDDPERGQERLQTLIEHHRFSRSGFTLVPQGTPTNNTESGGAGWSRTADADEAFDLLGKTSLFTDEPDWLKKSDGQWLAEYLGIDPAALQRIANADGRDQTDARAMNIALWPATLGYWMDAMMGEPAHIDHAMTEKTRDFFTRYVSGRGAIPAVRIGRQPYGILPATAFSHMEWLTNEANATKTQGWIYLNGLHGVLSRVTAHWELMRQQVSFAGKADGNGDPHQLLLDIVGLHSGSAELFQRWAESLQHLLRLIRRFYPNFDLDESEWTEEAREFLQFLAGTDVRPPEILTKFFIGKVNRVEHVVDTVPLSETAPLTVTRADKKNYIEWLIDAAGASLAALYAQEGFGGTQPKALLYVMLRHALQLGYHDVSLKLHVEKQLINAGAAMSARSDAPFINIDDQSAAPASKYAYLFKNEPAIHQQLRVDEHIAASLANLQLHWPLQDQIAALKELATASTARLERAFVDHLDTCSYRLDAWFLGFVHKQLARMRGLEPDASGGPSAPKRGIYLGAYAWVEDLKPETKTLTPVPLLDPDLAAAFGSGPPLTRDSNNFGYIHAPSLNQAVAAAVLRNGYKQTASKQTGNTLAVNLTSERVRAAMAMIEGIRNGQSLGALLGYQFERGLHDRYTEAEVDGFILELRAKFPLAGNKLKSTNVAALKNIREVEARNVIDGLKLIEHITKTGQKTYPFGFGADLPAASPTQAGAIDKEVERLRETHDAVSDLATAEGVYQAILGNYDRAGSTYDAYAKGTLPPEPQVVRTPPSGKSLTHRVALHLDPDALPGPTPRSIAEPSLNAWLAGVLPPLNQIGCKVHYRATSTDVTLGELGISPRDMLELVHDGRQAMNELDDRILRVGITKLNAHPDDPVTIEYRAVTSGIPIFEVMPLVRSLRTLFEGARPLRPTDLTLSRETLEAADDVLAIQDTPIKDARAQLFNVNASLDGYIAPHQLLLADPVANRGVLLSGIDADIDALVPVLADAVLFGIPQTGWGFAYDTRRGAYNAILKKVADAAQKMVERDAEFTAVMAELPAAAGDPAAELEILYRAERLISTDVQDSLTENDLTAIKHPAFLGQLAALQNVKTTAPAKVSDLLAAVKALPDLAPFTFDNLSFQQEEETILALSADLLRLAQTVHAEGTKRHKEAGDHIAKADAAADPAARNKALDAAAKAMFGEHFTVIPRFTLTAKQGTEIEQSRSAVGARLAHLAAAPFDDAFPVDTWLYGIARVRDKMRAWEQTVMLAEAFDTASKPALDPLQFPFVQDEPWLGLDFPVKDFKIPGERLLYTASFSVAFDKTDPQCGVLLDEWTEVIPGSELDTGLAFHFDRPSNEAPQAMLLVTPTDQREKWIWSDVVDALNDTLDFAKRRAVEPDQLHDMQYPRFLPAAIMAVTYGQLSISAAILDPQLKVNQP